MKADPLHGQILKWPIDKDGRAFRVYVVEPTNYDPKSHAAIFNGSITALFNSEAKILEDTDKDTPAIVPENFDLVTFPEAFLPACDLTAAIKLIAGYGKCGCVHVGLRPSASDQNHLFSVDQINQLISSLVLVARETDTDMKVLREWLEKQHIDSRFNLACLFAMDADRKMRVCIHPKMVKSKFESSPLHETNMSEANLLTLVTLLPIDRLTLSVTVQPLICSDALALPTDRPGHRPLDAVNRSASCFTDYPPDQVDVVSVATCTPQPELTRDDGERSRQWHEEFRSTFERVGSDSEYTRHHHSTFVLSNFQFLPKQLLGGLSGAYVPTKMGTQAIPNYIQVSSYGRTKDAEDNRWLRPSSGDPAGFKSRGYIAQVNPYDADMPFAKMIGFTISRFPKEVPHWRAPEQLVDFQLRTATYDKALDRVTFEKRDE